MGHILPVTDGKDWFGLSYDERHDASCGSSTCTRPYRGSGEHPMERPNFRFTDWYAVKNAIREVLAPLVERAGVGQCRDPEVGQPHIIQAGGSDGHRFREKEDLKPPLPFESTSWKDLAESDD